MPPVEICGCGAGGTSFCLPHLIHRRFSGAGGAATCADSVYPVGRNPRNESVASLLYDFLPG